MVELLNIKKHKLGLNEFLKNYRNDDFYLTEKDHRVLIKDEISLKKLLKSSIYSYVIEEKGDILGLIVLWKSVVEGQIKYYVKLNAINNDSVERLITNLVWNCDKEMRVKLSRYSKFLKAFYNKGFCFIGNRGTVKNPGSEILLSYKRLRKYNAKYSYENKTFNQR
jgi:hypothetical protein